MCRSATDPDRLHADKLVADLHCDTIIQMRRGYDLSRRHETYHVDIPRLKEGGVNLQVFAASISPHVRRDQGRVSVHRAVDVFVTETGKHSADISLCLTASSAERAVSQHKVAAVLSIENGQALDNDPANLGRFHAKGVRLLTLAHFASTDWCIAWNDEAPRFHGLNELGREMIAEMNDLGMIIDVSHSAPSTVEEVLRTTRHPVIASHSCAYSLCPHGRNLTDEQARAIADNGGMVGIAFVNMLLSHRFHEASSDFWSRCPEILRSLSRLFGSDMPEEQKEARYAEFAPHLARAERALSHVRASVASVAEHIDHFVDLVGPDHVGLGSDFDGMYMTPVGLEDCSSMPKITRELVTRGYAETDIEKILGGNFMRVFRQVCG